MPLDCKLVGAGLVIGARARLDAFFVGPEVRFVDSCDLAALRVSHPAWRSVPLAPVELLDQTGMLAEVEDDSVDFVIDWAMMRDPDEATQRFSAAARVLHSGSMLVLPVCDSRFVEIDAEAESIFAGFDRLVAQLQPEDGSFVPQRQGRERWPFARFTTVVAALAAEHAPWFELEQVRRYGRYNLALLRRRRDLPIEGRSVIADGAHCYVLDGSFLRHITSMDTLNQLRAAAVPTINISLGEQALFVAGPPLNPNDVAKFLAKTDAFS